MPTLHTPDGVFSFEEAVALQSPPDYLKPVCDTVRAWQSGQEDFPINTSGSTGQPKVIRLTRAQMEASARMTAAAFDLNHQDLLLCPISAEHIGGKMMVVRALVLGADLVITPPASDAFTWAKDLPQPTLAAFVPLQVHQLLSNPQAVEWLNRMRSIILGGGEVSQALQEELDRLRAAVYQTYGMTETCSHIAIRRLNGPEASEHYQALPGMALKQDERECLMVKGAVTQNEWLTTNDRVALLPGSRFLWLGRWDNVINTGGIKVQAEEVEQAIQSLLPRGVRYFITSLGDEKLGQKVVLVLEMNPLPETEMQELLAQMKTALPRFHAPRELFFSPAFSETPTAKVQKAQTLREILAKTHYNK